MQPQSMTVSSERHAVTPSTDVPQAGATTTEDELLEFCSKRLAAHEVPSSVVLVDSLPRSSVGKLLRHELVETTSGKR